MNRTNLNQYHGLPTTLPTQHTLSAGHSFDLRNACIVLLLTDITARTAVPTRQHSREQGSYRPSQQSLGAESEQLYEGG